MGSEHLQWLKAAELSAWGGESSRAIAFIDRGLACPLAEELRIRLLGKRCELHIYRIELAPAGLHSAHELLRIAEPGSAPWAQASLIAITVAAITGDLEELARLVEDLVCATFSPEAADAASLAFGVAVLALAASMGACSYFMRDAFLRLHHVECLEALGRHEDARAKLEEAREALSTMAAKIEDAAYRRSYLNNVPENRRTLSLYEVWSTRGRK